MLVICEDCGKKYNIDESRITRNRARFTCNECGHIIIVDKTDLTRPLFCSVNPGAAQQAAAVDLVREMEAPATATATAPDQQEKETKAAGEEKHGGCNRRRPQWKFRGIPLFTYFILAMIFALVFISVVTGYLFSEYLYTEYMAATLNKSFESKSQFVLQASLIFGGAWFVVLILFSIMGWMVHRKFRSLVKNANKLATGDYTVEIVKNGPREVRDLAFALERIRQFLQASRM